MYDEYHAKVWKVGFASWRFRLVTPEIECTIYQREGMCLTRRGALRELRRLRRLYEARRSAEDVDL